MKKVWTLCLSLVAVALLMPAPVAAQSPDLQVVLNDISPDKFGCGIQTVTFDVDEINAGSAASGPFALAIQVSLGNGFTTICNKSRPSLAASTTRNYVDSCTFWNGPCDCIPVNDPSKISFRAFIDSIAQVTESNENNNFSNIITKISCCDLEGDACCAGSDVLPIEDQDASP
jgi:hypothetical protein